MNTVENDFIFHTPKNWWSGTIPTIRTLDQALVNFSTELFNNNFFHANNPPN